MSRKSLPIALVLAAVLFVAGPSLARADQPVPILSLDSQAEWVVGSTVVLSAYLIDPAGNPISGQQITFESDAEFMNTLGSVKLGQATTDKSGLAYLKYVPTSTGDHNLTARFSGNEVFGQATATEAFAVVDGPPIYNEPVPFRIPGANVNLVVTVLTVVWGLYLLVAVSFWLIGREGSARDSERQVER